MFRVLIVDDEEIVLEGLHRILSKIPEVTVVAKMYDGASAKEYLECHMVDAVFTDIRMPVMDGIKLASWLCENRPDCKIVFISAYNDFSYAQQAMRYGVKNYLSKPIRKGDVNKITEQLLRERDQLQRRELWNRDLKRESKNLELYNAFVYGEMNEQSKGPFLFADYEICVDRQQCETVQLNSELMSAALINIFRWCAPQCICVRINHQEDKLCYTLIGQDESCFPEAGELVHRIWDLVEVRADVNRGSCTDVQLLCNRNQSGKHQLESDKIILTAKAYIRANLSRNISRNDVAQAVHLEPSYFSKYFKKKTGINFHEYLQNERINRAKELLRAGSKVQDAAREAGFYNRNYFNQVFKQYTGYSPSQFKGKADDR